MEKLFIPNEKFVIRAVKESDKEQLIKPLKTNKSMRRLWNPV